MTTMESHAPGAAATSGAALAGIADWVTTTDHKRIGRIQLVSSAVLFLGSAVMALLLAVERVDTTREWLDVGSLSQIFSLYRFGLTYLVMLPAIVGIAVAIVPLQVGSRSIAFPRLAAAGCWAWLLGGGVAVYAIVNNGGPNGGNARFVDLFTVATVVLLLGLVASLVSVATTILTTRAPGMNMRRVPLFSWSVLVMAIALLVALPVLIGDLLYLFVAHRYPSVSPISGNRSIDQWASFGFSQPTTILFAIPVFGFLAEQVATATRRRMPGRGVVFAAIGLIGLGVFGTVLQWPATLRPGFLDLDRGDQLSDLLPFGMVNVLPVLGALGAVALCAKALTVKPKVTAPLVFGLLAALLALGGAAASIVLQVGDAGLVGTTFEEGTWLALVYAGVLATMGAVAYWGPKWWGRTMPMQQTLPLALLGFLGAELASLPLLVAGFADQPGGVFPAVEPGADAVVNFDYSGPQNLWNLASAAGHALVFLAVLAFVALALRSFLTGPHAGDDPWDGQTLEWATASPPPHANFSDVHIVRSAEPLLDLKPSTRSDV